VAFGLLAHEIEARHGGPEWMPARLTVDMYRLPDLSPVAVTTRAVREGGRLRLIEADFTSGGAPMARAACQLLRRTANPPGRTWSPPDWDAPPPEDVPLDDQGNLGGVWATRRISGGFGGPWPRRLWMAEVRELIGGEPLSPFVRAALAADFTSPWANAGDGNLAWINSDITLYLHRLPASEWIGFDVVNHQATDGVGLGECWLYDVDGSIGTCTVAALAQRRAMGA
jgi:hypothetical protein